MPGINTKCTIAKSLRQKQRNRKKNPSVSKIFIKVNRVTDNPWPTGTIVLSINEHFHICHIPRLLVSVQGAVNTCVPLGVKSTNRKVFSRTKLDGTLDCQFILLFFLLRSLLFQIMNAGFATDKHVIW